MKSFKCIVVLGILHIFIIKCVLLTCGEWNRKMTSEEVERKIISGGKGWTWSERLIRAVARECQMHNESRTKYLIVIKTLGF